MVNLTRTLNLSQVARLIIVRSNKRARLRNHRASDLCHVQCTMSISQLQLQIIHSIIKAILILKYILAKFTRNFYGIQNDV